MDTLTIPPEQWTFRLNKLSESFEGWPVSLDVIAPADGQPREFSQIPLLGITAEPNGPIVISVAGATGEHVTHIIQSPTRGPGAGKTAVLELVRQEFCGHVQVLPETASIVFGGGFPRTGSLEWRRGAQRAIFFVQRELESTSQAENAAIVLCDRGTVDGAVYWPGPESFWDAVRTTRERDLSRYDAVIHLRTPPIDGGYNHTNPLRLESAMAVAEIDAQLLKIWDGHPRRFVVPPSPDFPEKAVRTVEILKAEIPDCCRGKERHYASVVGS